MATPKKIEKDDIEVARQRLLAAIYSELPDDRYLKKQAVKQLLSTLIAARERGLSFEKIAEILQQSGLDLPPSSLRSYYFDLKTQADLAAEAERHARKVAATREAIERKALERHAEHGAAVAERYARIAQSKPRLVNAFSDLVEQTNAPEPKPAGLQGGAARRARPASPAVPLPRAAATVRIESEEEGHNARPQEPEMVIPTSEGDGHRAEDASSQVLTLAEIEAASAETEARTELTEDLELRGEFVYYVSGRPFAGHLTKRQIHLLRSVGRIVAPTKGKSSKDFVAMPQKL
ncbi:hypothetical protein FX016_22935 [Cupriavidus gilardii]|nr:hypothetical protein FX016_22935 [Cupriavidus gilardii]